MNAMEVKPWILYCAFLLTGSGQSDPLIFNCPSGKVAVREEAHVSFTCGYYTNGMRWFSSNGETGNVISRCFKTKCSAENSYSCYSRLDGEISHESTLIIFNIQRDQALYLGCEDTETEQVSWCKLRVIAAVVTKSCDIWLSIRRVLGKCKLSGMYDSDNNYTCVWRRDNEEFLSGFQSLQNYKAWNGREYQIYKTGVCVFNQSVPLAAGTYTFSVSLSPSPVNLFSRNISIGCSELHNCGSSRSVSGGLIGGVLGAVIIIIIITAIISVYVIKRRKVSGELGGERGIFRYFSGAHKLFQRNSPVSEPYAVVTKPKTQSPIARHAAPSGDLYTIASTTTAGHASDEYSAVYEMSDNGAYTLDTNDDLQVTKAAHQSKDSKTQGVKTSVEPKRPTATVKTFPNVSGTDYMNVTEIPTDSGLGVYHIVPWAAISGGTQPATCHSPAPVFSQDEYNVLHFEQDRPPQGHQEDNYHHLQLQ